MEARRNFQGVLNILSFNRHFYVLGFGILVVIFASRLFFEWPNLVFWMVVATFVYGLTMPLLVSAYVYDLSGYYKFHWLSKVVSDANNVKLVASIHAGFDETSFILKEKFPGADLRVFDFYDGKQHTEPAIKRARKVSSRYPGTRQIASDHIPLQDKTFDLIFLLSAVHEIRSPEEKLRFLRECHRVCKPGGKVIMVEHLRDLPNFLAFSVGFTHFFSRSVWKKSFEHAGFHSFHEIKFTPFMSVFSCSP